MELLEVKINGERKAYGPEESFPTAQERKNLRASGHKIYVDGKLYQEK